MTIDDDNVERFEDRNGHLLEYGDQVLAKIWSSCPTTVCTVVGFTKRMVLIVPNGSQTTAAYRKSSNLVFVKNLERWKLNF